MTNNKYTYDFHRFDGEGGGEGLGPEASAFMASLGGADMNEPHEEPTQVYEYGLPQGDEGAGQVGSDIDEAESLEQEFASLVGKGGKFHDLYGQGISNAIQNRFRNQTDYEGQVGQYEDAVAPLFQKYGLEAGDVEGLANAIETDEDLYRTGAEREGIDVDQYKQNLKLKADAERGRQITEAYEMQQQQNEMFAQWDAEAYEMQSAVPNFDLVSEIENNETFARLLDAGISVKDAFFATHAQGILNGLGDETSKQAQTNVVNTIRQRAARPLENGVTRAPAVQRKTDPNSFTDDDIDRIFEHVRNGGTLVL